MEDVIYFELNNWTIGEDYPAHEPFVSWMSNDLDQAFLSREWVKENRLIVIFGVYDMSMNYYIAAPKSWVIENCSSLLDEDKKFLLIPDKDGIVDGRFGSMEIPYDEEHIGKIFCAKECEDNNGFLYYSLEEY